MPIPTVRATIAAPEPLLKDRAFLRLHNRTAKEALREQALEHHKRRIPLHFQRSAASKYGHRRRTDRYMRFKARRFRSVTDLVKTGRARDEMTKTPPVIRIGGKAADDAGESGELKLTLTMPFHVGQKAQAGYAKKAVQARRGRPTTTRAKTAGVSIAQMKKEIASITEDEAREIGRGFLKAYGRRLAVGLAKAPRLRKRVSAARS